MAAPARMPAKEPNLSIHSARLAAMSTIISCPACGRKLKLPDHFPGGRAKCTCCNNRLEISLYSDGSHEVTIPPGALVPVRPTPESWPKREMPPARESVPEQSVGQAEIPKRPPFLTRTGAVIRCPHCNQ